MSVTLVAEPPPLSVDAEGRIRVAGTRVFLDLVIADFRRGLSAEQIADRYDAVGLADVFGALRYYLTHRAEVDEYLARRDAEATALEMRIIAAQGRPPTRDELLARRTFRPGERAPVGGIWRTRGDPPQSVALSAGETFPPIPAGSGSAGWAYQAGDPSVPGP